MPAHYVAIYQSMVGGDIQRAFEVQKQVNRMTEVLLDVGVYQGIKYAMGILGIDYGVCREPFLPLDASQEQKIKQALETLNFKGFIE
jgi:N-acetylneuraminate lyase